MVFFFNDTATTEIYTLSLHDALPISVVRDVLQHLAAHGAVEGAGVERERRHVAPHQAQVPCPRRARGARPLRAQDRKSTRLNSSHANISYAVFCLKKKNTIPTHTPLL